MTVPGMAVVSHRDMTASAAQKITDRIRSSMGNIMADIAKAYLGRVWIAMGYESWADYVKGEFEYAPLSLPREERKAVVTLLRGQGMSTRAIGSATGVDQKTVVNDLATEENSSVEITGVNGKKYQPTAPKDSAEQPLDVDEVPAEQPAPAQTVTCPTCHGTGKVVK